MPLQEKEKSVGVLALMRGRGGELGFNGRFCGWRLLQLDSLCGVNVWRLDRAHAGAAVPHGAASSLKVGIQRKGRGPATGLSRDLMAFRDGTFICSLFRSLRMDAPLVSSRLVSCVGRRLGFPGTA